MLALAALVAILPALTLAKPVDLAQRNPSKRYTGVLIKANRDGLCISVNGGTQKAVYADGTAVVSIPCSQATTWDINPGSGSVLVSGHNGFALDAGTNPTNNGPLKIWTSYPGLMQQTWYYTGDDRIAITGGTQCLDEGPNGIQTYQCTTGNTNQTRAHYHLELRLLPNRDLDQFLFLRFVDSFGVTPNIPTGKVYPDPPVGGGQRLHPYGRDDLCLSALGGAPQVGSEVEITYCFDNNDPNSKAQLWDVPAKGATGPVRIINTDLCLDAGNNPGNGSGLKVWTCYDGLIQQTWKRGAGNSNTFGLSNVPRRRARFHRPEPPPLFGTRERPDLAVLEQRRCPAGVLHAIVGAGHPEPYHATTTTIPITTARSLALPRCASTDMSDGEERARTTLRRSKIPRIDARTMTRPH
ncbi:hypothetical protein EHS25_005293 [Saitozyma podzolica]|uniref:Ricin B lectin domain-containing protein n=1 Tax=Saitozyma podzolica TaxID=1890683 RepID=A0A427XYT7_9TREE|nr:hypothetical protein EHS25_005293 [Saitozyma podzolica]